MRIFSFLINNSIFLKSCLRSRFDVFERGGVGGGKERGGQVPSRMRLAVKCADEDDINGKILIY